MLEVTWVACLQKRFNRRSSAVERRNHEQIASRRTENPDRAGGAEGFQGQGCVPFTVACAGVTWGFVVVLWMCTLPASEIIGEAPFFYLIVVSPLLLVAAMHSFFLRLGDRQPLYYGVALGILVLNMALPYRYRLPEGNTSDANITLVALAIVVALLSTALLNVPPLVKWLVERYGMEGSE